jgi:hypothetical protein
MANAIISWPNRVDEATLAGGAWSSGLPLANLKSSLIGKVARSATAATADTQFTVVFPAARPVRVVALVSHSMVLTGGWRVTAYSDAAMTTQVHASGFQWAWPSPYRNGDVASELYAWRRWNSVYVLPAGITARAIKVQLENADHPVGYLDVGRLFVSGGWQPVRNLSFGLQRGWESRSSGDQSLGGVEHFDRRQPRRVQRFTFEHLSVTEGMGIFDLQGAADVVDEVMHVLDPGDEPNMLRGSFLGRMRQLSAIEFPGPLRTQAAFELAEIL